MTIATRLDVRALDTSAAVGVLTAVAVSTLMLAPLLALAGADVQEGYRVLFGASIGSGFAFSSWLVATTPLLVTALGVTFAYRCGMFNVGADGQIILGATAAIVLLPHVEGLPALIAIVLDPVCRST